MKLTEHFYDVKRMLKFATIGFSGVFVNSGILWLLVNLEILPFYLCSFIAIESAIISNFLLNDMWTWSDRRRGHKFVRLLKYNLSTAFSSVFINMTVLLLLKEWAGMNYILANLIGIGCGMLFNFFINNIWTYGTVEIKLPRSVWAVLLISLVWRTAVALFIGPGFDEAYYYAYSIRPALSYFDHPPLVGFLAGFFPYLTESATTFTIRLSSVLLFTLSGLFLYSLAKQLVHERAAFYAFILFNLTPLFMLLAGIMILPDAGLVFFWILALYVFVHIYIRDDYALHNWIIAGILTGLAMLSKYHGVFLAGSAFLLLVLRRPRQLMKPEPYLYALGCTLVFLPVLIWNIQNNFVSFAFQGGRAVGGSVSLDRFFQALGGQMAYITPFIFLPLLYTTFRVVWQAARTGDKISMFISIFGAAPLFFIFIVSLFRPILPHWTLPAYLILLIPLGQWLADFYPEKRMIRLGSWFTIIFIFIVLLLAALHMQFGIFQSDRLAQNGELSPSELKNDVTLDTYGWEYVDAYLQTRAAQDTIFLFTHKWFLSGEVDLAVEGKYPVMCFNQTDARGYGLWDADLDMRGKDGMFICTNRHFKDPRQLYADYFADISGPDSMIVNRGGDPVKILYFFTCKNLIKKYPLAYARKTD